MADFGCSDNPRVQAQLDRLGTLTLRDGRIDLDTVRALFTRLGNPQDRLPPVFHVAGTNGKGSTCAFLRAILEAQGYRVHATTSPHLVRYNERIRLAGELISDARLAELLAEVFDASDDLEPSFFEVTIAAAFLEFARVPADACVVEVGLGGRLDATNVIERPAVCGIAALGIDHERFLLAPEDGVPTGPMARIAFEKAGIAKRGVPLVTLDYPPAETAAIAAVAAQVGAPVLALNGRWGVKSGDHGLTYDDDQSQFFTHTPLPLPGHHQVLNAGLAIAMLRHQTRLPVSEDAIRAGLANARWPARLQRLSAGPLAEGREVWLDGGHNASAGAALAKHFAGKRLHLVIGMIEGKNPASLTTPLAPMLTGITAVPVPGHDWHPAEAFGPAARSAPDLPAALAMVPDDGLPVLIAGSLYLAGEALRLNGEPPG